jgi:hypothetical protein
LRHCHSTRNNASLDTHVDHSPCRKKEQQQQQQEALINDDNNNKPRNAFFHPSADSCSTYSLIEPAVHGLRERATVAAAGVVPHQEARPERERRPLHRRGRSHRWTALRRGGLPPRFLAKVS